MGANLVIRSPIWSTLVPSDMAAKTMFVYPAINHILDDDGHKETMDSLMTGKSAATWTTALPIELGRLSQGIHNRTAATDTIVFIAKSDVPSDKKVTYGNFICDYRPLKSEKYRVRLTVGGDRLKYARDAGAPAESLLETKLIVNSTISDAHADARFMCAGLKEFFHATPMDEPEFMRVKYKYFQDEIRKEYNINAIVAQDAYVYIKIQKGMYGLKQATVLAYNHLVQHLARSGYQPCPYTNGFGNIKHKKPNFVYVSTTLELNTSPKTTPTI